MKAFISYSHKDKNYLDELHKHLAVMRRDGLITEWTDSEVFPGGELESEILQAVESCEMFLMLISPDFLASDFCVEQEMERAFERFDIEGIKVIPIIVEPCDWKSTSLKTIKALPKDGKPISEWPNKNNAYVDIIKELRNILNKPCPHKEVKISQRGSIHTNPRSKISTKNPNKSPRSIRKKGNEIEGRKFTKSFSEWLEDTGVPFKHKRLENIRLTDLFVYPDLKRLANRHDEMEFIQSSESLSHLKNVNEGVLIYGDEQSGKTSLAKMLFRSYFEQSYLPLLIESQTISKSDIDKSIARIVSGQYENFSWEEFRNSDRIRILILDDFHQIKLNIKYQKVFLENLEEVFEYIVLMADRSITMDEHRMADLVSYRNWEILPFGHARRGDLIRIWNSLGHEETIDSKILHRLDDVMTRKINSIIIKDVLPPKPIYLITVLQLLDSTTQTDFSLTAFGYCYQSLIQQSLQKIGVQSKDFDSYVNYLSELAFHVFSRGKREIVQSEFGEFKKVYSEKFLIQSHDKLLENLHKARILCSGDEKLSFSYKYIFYFYTAKYLSDHLSQMGHVIEHICANMHTETNANILIFLMHHTRDERVLDEILLREYMIFDGEQPSTFDKEETKHILEYVKDVEQMALEKRDIESERKKALEIRDIKEKEFNEDNDEYSEVSEVFADIIRSARMVDVIGQILRNRYGSMPKNQLVKLARSGYDSGLKFMTFWLNLTRQDEDYLLSLFSAALIEHKDKSDDQRRKIARRAYLNLTYGVCISVIQRIANSLGSEQLLNIFDYLESERPDSIAVKLICITIKLEFTKQIPKDELSRLYSKLGSNQVARLLLQQTVIHHLYLNEVSERDMQWISSNMRIPMKSQRQMIRKKARKK